MPLVIVRLGASGVNVPMGIVLLEDKNEAAELLIQKHGFRKGGKVFNRDVVISPKGEECVLEEINVLF